MAKSNTALNGAAQVQANWIVATGEFQHEQD